MQYQDILKQKEYMKFYIANSITRFADSLDAIAFTWLVYSITNSAAWSAIIFGLNQLPTILLQPFMGVIADMFNRKRLIVFSHLARFSAVFLILYWVITNQITPYKLAIFTLLISTFESINMPASTSLVPELITPDMYAHANSLSASTSRICELIGTCFAGVLIGLFGVQTVFMIDAFSFLVAACIESTIHHTKALGNSNLTISSYFKELTSGMSYVKQNKFVYNFMLMAVIINAILVPFTALQAPIVEEIYTGDSTFLSYFNITLMIGMIAGSLLTPKIMQKFKMSKIILYNGLALGVIILFISQGAVIHQHFVFKHVYVGIFMILLGIILGNMNGAINIRFMQAVDKDYLARCSALTSAASLAANPIMSFVVSAFVIYISIPSLLVISSLLSIFAFLLIYKKLNLDA